MREHLWSTGLLYSKVVDGKETEGANFRDWFDFNEPLRTLPSHRILALLRGRQQGVLELRLGLEAELEAQTPHSCVARIADFLKLGRGLFALDATPRARWLGEVCRWTWRVKLLTAFESELIGRLRERRSRGDPRVRGQPERPVAGRAGRPQGRAGPGPRHPHRLQGRRDRPDRQGRRHHHRLPFEPRRDREGTINTLAALVARHKVDLIAIGNGTASRESEAGGRHDGTLPRPEGHARGGLRKPAPRSTPRRNWPRRNSRTWT